MTYYGKDIEKYAARRNLGVARGNRRTYVCFTRLGYTLYGRTAGRLGRTVRRAHLAALVRDIRAHLAALVRDIRAREAALVSK